MRTKIVSTGAYLPECVIKNSDLTGFPANFLPLIEQKTGIRERRHAEPNQATSDLALAAARLCLERAKVDSTNVDAIVLATSTPDRLQPATATRVQHLLGARNAFAVDINSVCSGALFGLKVVDALVRSESCRKVLLIGADVYSRFLNPRDFSTYPYFGDGAGAVLLEAGSESAGGILNCVVKSDGSGSDVIQVPAGGSRKPGARVEDKTEFYFKMNGKEVFEFAVRRGTEMIQAVMREQGLAASQIRWVISHQANRNIISKLAENTGIGLERFIINLDRYGNTASASVLLALDEAIQDSDSKPGDYLVLVSFGGGLSWGGAIIQL